jgi:hypothetical protein
MAELSIRLERNERTGALEIRLGLVSDEDEPPAEHERRHRQLVAALLPGLRLGGDPPEGVEVERERPAREPAVG